MSTHPFTSARFEHNPFIASAQTEAAPAATEESYVMVARGPAVRDDEVLDVHVDAIEVMVLWGTTVLHVSHLTPPRSFFVGESGDYILPGQALGDRAPVVVVRDGSARLVIPANATGSIEIKGHGSVRIEDLVGQGRATPSSELAGAHEVELPAGAKAKVALTGTDFSFAVSAVHAGKSVAVPLLASLSSAAHRFVGLSFLAHAGVIASLAFFMPSLGADDTEATSRDDILLMQKMLNASAERDYDQRNDETKGEATKPDEGGSGQRADGEEGQMGSTVSKNTVGRFGIKGPAGNADPQIARKQELAQAAEFGMIGMLLSSAPDPKAPTAPWGSDVAIGNDPKSALGNMWAPSIDEALGNGGLGLSSTGEGGGGDGKGIGVGRVGTIGHGDGTGKGVGFGPGNGGIGNGSDRVRGGHDPHPPTLRDAGPLTANGHIPQEVIQRIVRLNFGRFRACYESGLVSNPGLTGRVAVKFVIGRDGSVSMSQDGGSDLPDQAVVQCVVRNFQNLSFPKPDGGIVTVSYPILFTPGQ